MSRYIDRAKIGQYADVKTAITHARKEACDGYWDLPESRYSNKKTGKRYIQRAKNGHYKINRKPSRNDVAIVEAKIKRKKGLGTMITKVRETEWLGVKTGGEWGEEDC